MPKQSLWRNSSDPIKPIAVAGKGGLAFYNDVCQKVRVIAEQEFHLSNYYEASLLVSRYATGPSLVNKDEFRES